MVTASIVLLYVSYSIPVVCLLIRGRKKSLTGPFYLGGFGLFANCVLLAWTLFTVVMYSFPYAMPVSAGNMNYGTSRKFPRWHRGQSLTVVQFQQCMA